MDYFLKIRAPYEGKRYAIGDIHGCCESFKALVRKLQLQKHDQLFLLGDFIDRGPDSAGVIDFILALKDKGYQVYPLRGNHENMLLENWNYYTNLKLFSDLERFVRAAKANQIENMLDSSGRLKERYFQFMQSLPYYYETDDYYLVHAGFDFKQEKPFEDYDSMIWIRGFPNKVVAPHEVNYKKILVGHTVRSMDEILEAIAFDNTIIPLDNGCYEGYYFDIQKRLIDPKMTKTGNLCALDMDLMQLIVQECVD